MAASKWSAIVPNFTKWSLGNKIFLGSLFFLIIPLFITFTFILHTALTRLHISIEDDLEATGSSIAEMMEASIDTALSQHLRAIAETDLQFIEWYHKRQLDGTQGENKAKQDLRDILSRQKVGSSGYVYCIDSLGVVQFHPESKLVGKNILHLEEYKAAWPFIGQQITAKQGYLEYSWKNPSESGPHPKALSMEYFQPWDWIISVVCYRQEFESIVDFKTLAKRITETKFGRTGHPFILNARGELLGQELMQAASTPENTEQLHKIKDSAWNSDRKTISYQWKNQEDRAAKEKLLFFKKIPQFGLVVGVSVDETEVHTNFTVTRLMTALMLLVGAVLATCISFFMSRALATPLQQFARQLKLPGRGREYSDGCETTFLSEQFTQLLQAFHAANEKLNVEVQFKKSAETFLQIYKKIFDNATEGIIITDAAGRILSVNDAFTTITGYEPGEVIGQNPRILKSGHHNPEFFEQMWQHLVQKGEWEGEIWNKKKDGTLYPEWLTINSIFNERNEIAYYFAMFNETGELKKREKQIAFMAYHDILTKLPNRSYLENKLVKTIAKTKSDGGIVAIFFIDLDNFKNVNDVFGHNQGDDLLVQVTQRFTSVLGGNDTLYRLGSDEFVLLMEHIDNESVIYLMANRIFAVLKKPFLLEFKKIYVNASIGISIYPGDGETGADLIRSADLAMHKAKREGKNRHILFTKGMHEELYEKFRIENGIRYGLLNREFIVYYQPKVNIITRKTSSMEALIRWQKGGQLIRPDAFIPIAEESSLIDDLCLFVMEETCAFHTVMQKHEVAVPVSVNISPRQFHNADFVDIVEDLLGRYQVDPKYLEFEITETTAMKDVEHTLNIMHRIRQLGILFSIDDFGTGYSSLGYLNKMPVSTLKIDKQFVDDLQENSGIVATIIAISQQMHLNVVAEGVETEEQLLSLASMGCHEAQGYYFSRPVSGDNILQYLLAESSTL